MKLSYATSTTATMISQMNKFVAFMCRYHLLDRNNSDNTLTIPTITTLHLIFFMGYLELAKHTSYISIASYVSSVRVWCRTHGRPDPGIDPTTDKPDLTYFNYCRALKRKMAGTKKRREPLTLSQLDTIIKIIQNELVCPTHVGQNLQAAITTAFFLMLRISEYTAKEGKHEIGVTASRSDVVFFPSQEKPDGFTLTIHKSKTDQFRVGAKLTVCTIPNSHLCPVTAMKNLFDNQPAEPSAPLFNFGPATEPTSHRAKFIQWFTTILTYAGISTNEIKPHSLRSGGATAYLAAGIDTYVIQKMGRWASWCFTIYTQLTSTTIRESQIAMAFGPRMHQPVDLSPIREETNLHEHAQTIRTDATGQH